MPPEGLPVLSPAWAASGRVGALMSTREGGTSPAPWSSLNLGVAVGDAPERVAANRAAFAAATGARPVFLRQVHGTRVLRLTGDETGEPPEADAAFTTEPGIACTVQVADCMPVLLAAPEGRAVAAAHAGWRGLAGGVVDNALAALCEAAACAPAEVAVWLGPCIGPRQFEVGADVLLAFGADPQAADAARFVERLHADGHPRWLANLPQLARDRLAALGVQQVSSSGECTVEAVSRFFSFRRDGVTGRMAAAVWIKG